MPQYFTHLHLHTDHSLLDGAIAIDKLIAFAKQNNMPSIGISDHGNIFGAVKFFQQAAKAGIKPVLGIEMYLTEDAKVKDANNKYYHLLILVENEIGYKNLCKLISFAYTDGFYFKPRIDYRILEQHSEGLIVSSACMGGHIPTLLMQENYTEVDKLVDWYLQRFGPERFYLEVQPADQKEQIVLNERIFELSAKKNLSVIATCDSHYVSREDHRAHEVMLAIQTHAKMTDTDRFSFGDCRAHLRTQDEMLELFKDHPEAVWNTGAVADRCNFKFKTGTLFFPKFEIPAEHTEASYFRALCETGLQKLFDNKRIDITQEKLYHERLNEEIDLIIKMGFVGYFLVVSDFIQWAKNNGVPVGPGRGSAAGSLVAWSLQITDIDPIKYHLLFERFLNPERVTMPDIDIDFCIEGRERVIDYVRNKYGHDKVCQIITFGTMMAKGVLKDVARALGFPFEDSNALTDLIPDTLKITLKEALETEPRLKKLVESNPQVAELFDLAYRLEGLIRHASKHAAGIVISPEPIADVLPVYVPAKTTELVTQYAMTELEYLGFLKMDFLGLKNLTLIQRVLTLIKKNHNLEISIDHLNMDDAETFVLLCKGDTNGVFQLESDGIKDVLQRLCPHTFEDIIAVNALYRPGPLGSGMVDDFIERKHGRQAIRYIFPELEPILKDTYGVIVYQEQVMKIASAIAGYSLGEADILRRAMGKKKAEEMAKQKSIFVSKSQERGFDTKKAEELFELMAYFAGYGFNKSHSAAYALIAYQTAYLKAHFRPEFMACLISLEVSDPEKMAYYLDHARSNNLTILPPDINASEIDFSVIDGTIRFGLQGIKNIGGAALEALIQERHKKGPFKDLLDLCMRVDLRTCNKRVLESLICAGACDLVPGNRAQKHEELAKIIDLAHERIEAAKTGQMGLFDTATTTTATTDTTLYAYEPRDEWSDRDKLEKEKDALGIYLTAQPLDSYQKKLTWLCTQPLNPAPAAESPMTCCISVKSIRNITTKKGDRMAFVQGEDKTGNAEIIVFPKLFAKIEQWLQDHTIFVVTGTTDTGNNGACKIKAEQMVPIDLVFSEGLLIDGVTLLLPEQCDETLLQSLKEQIKSGNAKLSLVVHENGTRVKVATRHKIALTPELCEFIQQHQGDLRLQVTQRPAYSKSF